MWIEHRHTKTSGGRLHLHRNNWAGTEWNRKRWGHDRSVKKSSSIKGGKSEREREEITTMSKENCSDNAVAIIDSLVIVSHRCRFKWQ